MIHLLSPYLIAAISVCLLTYAAIKFYILFGVELQLVDQPNERKVHKKPIPVVGGISMVSALIMTTIINPVMFNTAMGMLIPFLSALGISFMAIIDDRYDISSLFRLAVQLALAALVAWSGVRIESMHGLFGIFEIAEPLQYFLTIVVIVGATNAFNLIDGLDGLAGNLGQVNALVFAALALYLGNNGLAIFCFCLALAIMIFLKFNQHPASIFMGDAGSMTLGFVFAFIGIKLLQLPAEVDFASYRFILVFCVILIPVIDAVRVFLQRYSLGKSIFSADKNHLHHLFLYLTENHANVSYMMTVLQLSIILLGMIMISYFSITTTALVLSIGQLLLVKVLKVNKMVAEWKALILKKEKGLE